MAILGYKVTHPERGTIAKLESLADAAIIIMHYGKGAKIYGIYLGRNGRVLYRVTGKENITNTARYIWERARDRQREIYAEEK